MGSFETADFEQIFSDLFQFFGPLPRDITIALKISLIDASHGAEHEVEYARQHPCESCTGTGGAKGATFTPCATCGGKLEPTREGHLVVVHACKQCAGYGGAWSKACDACAGRKYASKPAKLKVHVPPGVADGHRIRIAGKGNRTPEGEGDLYLSVEVEPHPHLSREGDDLCARLRVEPSLVERGGEVRVPWLEGSVPLMIAPGSRHGQRFVIPGWGAVRLGEPYSLPPPRGEDSPYRSAASAPRGHLIVTLTTHDEPTAEVVEARAEQRFKWGIVVGAAIVAAAALYGLFMHR
jgi:DnaJ-class molecular chaperone